MVNLMYQLDLSKYLDNIILIVSVGGICVLSKVDYSLSKVGETFLVS